MRISGHELGQPELVVGRCVPGLELQHLLEVLDRLGGLPLGQTHTPMQKQPVEIRRVLLEDHLQCLEAPVIVALLERDLRQAAPGGEKIRSLLGHFRQDSLGLIRLLGGKIEIDQLQPRR